MKVCKAQRTAEVSAWALAFTATCALAGLTASTGGAAASTIRVAYAGDYVYTTPEMAQKWWTGLKAKFEAQHPGDQVDLEPINGGYNDIITKLALFYRSPSTAPDIAEVPSGNLGQFVSAGYLAALNSMLDSADWWKQFPEAVQQETTFDGKVYAVNSGENTSGIYYNSDLLQKAGVEVPWKPQTWSDILDAGRKVKAKFPDVIPVWLMAGGGGSDRVLQGSGNLLLGSSDPTIEDAATQKWVADSPGLRETLGFYKTLFADGLAAPISTLFSPNATTAPADMLPKGQIAIAFGGNFFGKRWVQAICRPCWPDAPKVAMVATIPRENGQPAPNAVSTLGGWDLAMYSKTSNQSLAFDFLNLAFEQQAQVDRAIGAGFVPPGKDAAHATSYLDFAPPFMEAFADIVPNATAVPSTADYEVWAEGLNRATGAIAQDPSTSIDAAVDQMSSFLTTQLGADKVEVRK